MPPRRPLPVTPGASASRGFALGSLAGLGWALFDLGFFLQNGDPATALRLVPGSLAVAAGVGALGGLAALRGGLALGIAAFLVAASIVPLAWELPLSRARLWLPRALFLLLAASLAAPRLARLARAAPWTPALAAGAAAALAKTWYRQGWTWECTPLAAGLALLAGALWVRPAAARALFLGAAVVLPATWIAARLLPRVAHRPDLPRPAREAASDATSLLLVVLDTVRADHLSCYGYDRRTTPRLDARVAEHFVRHDSARSTSSWTLPSHASLFTGLLPAEHGCTLPGDASQRLAPEHRTLAERLRERGYRTAAVPANQVYLNVEHGLDQGFERFDDRRSCYVDDYLALAQLPGWAPDAGHVPFRAADRVSDRAIAWLERLGEGEPFFLMLNYMDAHKPYVLPAATRGLFEEREARDPVRPSLALQELLYDRGLWYADRELERVLRRLEELGRYDDTLVVVTSDHGEGLGDHGLAFHGLHVFESLIRVPLLVKERGQREAGVSAEPIHGAELHERIVRSLGLAPARRAPAPVVSEYYASHASAGGFAFRQREDTARLSDFATWLEGSRKLIVSSSGAVEAYDLAVDPGELEPLELSEAERAAALRRARAWWEAHDREAAPARSADPDGEDSARLEALGYG